MSMHPSPRHVYSPPPPTGSGMAASPKKKARPNALRQVYALPAIHQFEPVLASHATSSSSGASFSSPRPSTNVLSRDETPSAVPPMMVPLSPSSPHRFLGMDTKLSPRLRPQPPPAAAAKASRTDQDLFRYSQGVKQRMAIRPLFEQRREEEADIARRILASRETDPATSRQGARAPLEVERSHQSGDEQEREIRSPPRSQAAYSASRRATTPEIDELRSSAAWSTTTSTNAETPRTKRERLRSQKNSGDSSSGPATDRVSDKSGSGNEPEDVITNIRFRTPTPPSSAGPSRAHIMEMANVSTTVAVGDDALTDESGDQPSLRVEATTAREVYHTPETTTHDGNGGSSLVMDLTQTPLHAPFLEKRGSKLNWLARKPSTMQPPDTRNAAPHSPTRATPTVVCYKLLWKDTKPFPSRKHENSETETFDMRVLLGSNGRGHISIQPHGHLPSVNEEEQTIVIADSDLVVSAKTRPDLAVMTPKWARWILSRVERDAHGVWFLRIQDIFAMSDACVFTGDVKMKAIGASLSQAETNDDGNVVSVSIYLLGADGTDAEALLVHARDRSAAGSTLTEVVLKRHELMAVAVSSRHLTTTNESEGDPVGSTAPTTDEMRVLLRDPIFLLRAVAESKAVRLALKSGLHRAETTESAADLPFRTGSRSATAACSGSTDNHSGGMGMASESRIERRISTTIAEYEAQGLTYATPEIQILVRASEQLAEVAFLSQAYWEDAAASALRWLQRKQAVDLYVANYGQEEPFESTELSDAVRRRIAAATQAKLEDIAVRSIVEDMLADFIAVECRFELHHAKYSGGFDDYYASKVQSAYRMSYQRRDYVAKRNTRIRAVRLIQALQRGINARRRYCEMRVEREKYLFYGFRSSLHHSTANVEDPRHRAMDMSRETERRRQTFLMQVLHGYVAEHGLPTPFRISPELVQSIFNEYSVVVGCSPTLGDAVAAILITSRHAQPLPKKTEAKVPPPRLFGSSEIHAALITALRMQYDDTYGLSSSIRRIAASEKSPTKAQTVVTAKRLSTVAPSADENTPPRWLLKVSPPFQRANRNRLAALRLTQKLAGQRAAHFVALDYRNLLRHSFHAFDKCRGIWEDSIRSRKQQMLEHDAFSVDELVQYALDKLTVAVKDWGLDPEPLFEALNVCLLHRLGRQAIALTEQAFDRFARGVNELHGKRNVYPLRDEIEQELEEFEALLALRCLNIANDSVVTVPPSELLHVLLVGKVDEEYLRHALPSVLPIASVNEKVQLADKIVRSYANASYGEAFNSICWSCLDTAESVTVEAAQFLERITRRLTEEEHAHSATTNPVDDDGHQGSSASIAARALFLLTGSQALRFLQFLAKVAHFTKPLQRRVLAHLAPHAQDLELYRFASVVCSIDSFEVVTRLFDESFCAEVVHCATRFWVQYGALYGEARAEAARASCASPEELTHPEMERTEQESSCGVAEPTILDEPIAA